MDTDAQGTSAYPIDPPTFNIGHHLGHKVEVTFDYAEPEDSHFLYCNTCDETVAYLA